MRYNPSDTKYFCIDGNKDVAFTSEDDAMIYDMDMNPELHSDADQSMERVMKNIYQAPWSDLTIAQQTFLSKEFNRLTDGYGE